MYRIIISTMVLFLISGCSNHRILTIEKKDNKLYINQNFCYQINHELNKPKKIFKTNYLNNERQSSDFFIQYTPSNLLLNVINISKICTSHNVYIKEINVFKKHLSDTAQWRDVFYVEVLFNHHDDNYSLGENSFKDYETTGWVYDFKIHKPKNTIFTNTIEKALVRIFTDIEDAITNNLTLEQRNSKKDEARLETEKLMDKYIKLQKALE